MGGVLGKFSQNALDRIRGNMAGLVVLQSVEVVEQDRTVTTGITTVPVLS